MEQTAERPLVEQLPAVLAEGDFLARFVAAFETVFRGVEREIASIPELFALAPTPTLAQAAVAGSAQLILDSAADLLAGDLLRIEDVLHPPAAGTPHVEFAVVASVDGVVTHVELDETLPDALPTVVTLSDALRFAHPLRAPVAVVGAPGVATELTDGVAPGVTTIDVGGADAVAIAAGDVLRIDAPPEDVEYAQVTSVVGQRVDIAPPLLHPHEIARAVVVMSRQETTEPGAAFAYASRAGAELLVSSDALAGESLLELDTIDGLARGAVLHLREQDAAKIEFVRIAALPPEPGPGPGILRYALLLDRPLRHPHAAGVPVEAVSGATAGDTTLSVSASAPQTKLRVAEPLALGAATGATLRVGSGVTVEYAEVVAVDGGTVHFAPPFEQVHSAGTPVARLVGPAGLSFLGWLGGWVDARLRSDRGERWNRELVRLSASLWPWRGTRRGVQALVAAAIRGEGDALVLDLANPLQLGLVARLGVNAVLCGAPHFFAVDVTTNERSSRLYAPEGVMQALQAALDTLAAEKPAHTDYDLHLRVHTTQLGVDPATEVGARLGDTTLLWDEPLVVPGDDERSQPR
jgi:hypothetical protein